MNVLAIKTDQIYIIYKNFGRGMENICFIKTTTLTAPTWNHC